jgi:hypothetical protein
MLQEVKHGKYVSMLRLFFRVLFTAPLLLGGAIFTLNRGEARQRKKSAKFLYWRCEFDLLHLCIGLESMARFALKRRVQRSANDVSCVFCIAPILLALH